ncbi:MAG: hypothetical protein M5R36_06265 [Deltaproteobacteria bacterium]|nr:hypothetical protein [Deltaproteobacteria bacterium]
MSPQAGLTDEEAARRRLRREIILTIVIAIVITGLFILERYALSWPGAYPYANNLLFFGLINLNVILICVLLFLILRNLAKLLFERRQKILGSRLRTRLIVAFSGFALIPTVIMFYAAGTFVTRSIDNWFSGQIEASLNESLEVAKTYYSTYEESSLFFAKELALFVGKGDHVRRAPPVPKSGADDGAAPAGPGPLFDSEVLAPFLDAKRAEYHLDAVEIFLAGRMTPYYSSQSKIAKELYGDSAKDFLAQGFNGRESSEIFPYGKGEAVRGVAPIWTGGDIAGVVVVSYFVPKKPASENGGDPKDV